MMITDANDVSMLLSFTCAHCGAGVGKPCRDSRERNIKAFHERRWQEYRIWSHEQEMTRWATCPKCGGKGRVLRR